MAKDREEKRDEKTSVTATPARPSISELESLIATATPEQLEKLRAIAAAKGVRSGPRKTPTGSVLVEIEVPVDAIEQLNSWRESSGRTFEDEVKYWCAYLLDAFMGGQWMTENAAPAIVNPVPVPAAATVVPPAGPAIPTPAATVAK